MYVLSRDTVKQIWFLPKLQPTVSGQAALTHYKLALEIHGLHHRCSRRFQQYFWNNGQKTPESKYDCWVRFVPRLGQILEVI